MREDMDKVIVERPRKRRKQRPRFGREVQRGPTEDSVKREGIKTQYREPSGFNEHLAPLRRFLRSRVGRKWDLVYSEICANIRLASAVQSHVRDHVDQMVVVHCRLNDGRPCDATGARILSGRYYNAFWVHPDSGVLMGPLPPTRFRPVTAPPQPACTEVPIDGLHRFQWIDGLWYHITLKDVPVGGAWDVVWKRHVLRTPPQGASSHVRWKRRWRTALNNLYAAEKRQIGKREVRQLESRIADLTRKPVW